MVDCQNFRMITSIGIAIEDSLFEAIAVTYDVQRPREWTPGSPDSEVGLWWGGPLQMPSSSPESHPLHTLAGGEEGGGGGDSGFETPPGGYAVSGSDDDAGSEQHCYEEYEENGRSGTPRLCQAQ